MILTRRGKLTRAFRIPMITGFFVLLGIIDGWQPLGEHLAIGYAFGELVAWLES